MIESNINRDLENKIDLYVNGKLTADEINDLWVELIQDEYYLDYTKSLANIRAVIQQEKKSKQHPMYRLRKVAPYGGRCNSYHNWYCWRTKFQYR